MRRTPYSPFVEKETAPVLWYVRLASLVLLFDARSGRGTRRLIPTKTVGNEYMSALGSVNGGPG